MYLKPFVNLTNLVDIFGNIVLLSLILLHNPFNNKSN